MSFVDPSAQTFASLFDLVKSERNQYAIEPKHQPSKSQVQCFGRNCALLKEQPDPATKGRTSRERDEKARANVREMIKRFPSDLLVLSLLKIPKTKLSNLQDKWIGKIMEWWAGEDKPENLSKVALALCQHFRLIYRRQGISRRQGIYHQHESHNNSVQLSQTIRQFAEVVNMS